MICPNCSANLVDGVEFCEHCGAKIEYMNKQSQYAADQTQNTYQAQPQYAQTQPQYAQPQVQYAQPVYQPQVQYQMPVQPQLQYYYPQQQKKDDSSYGTLAIVLAVFVPLAGLIMGIIGKNKNEYSEETSKKCSVAIIISIVRFALAIISVAITWAVYFGIIFSSI